MAGQEEQGSGVELRRLFLVATQCSEGRNLPLQHSGILFLFPDVFFFHIAKGKGIKTSTSYLRIPAFLKLSVQIQREKAVAFGVSTTVQKTNALSQ